MKAGKELCLERDNTYDQDKTAEYEHRVVRICKGGTDTGSGLEIKRVMDDSGLRVCTVVFQDWRARVRCLDVVGAGSVEAGDWWIARGCQERGGAWFGVIFVLLHYIYRSC